MAARVFIHVGAPKTGTSFVQDILFKHRESLRDQGILYPADRHDAHFLAALDLMDLPWGGLEREAVGAWDRLAEQVRDWDGTAIISHEILGNASRVHVAKALASLGDTEVHVVMSARDLVRQIPAEWQENVKHRRTTTFATFLEDLREEERSSQVAQWFWAVQEVPDVLDRWGADVPREQVHLVTVPPSGSSPTLLWERFAGLFGLDAVRYAPTDRANASLGVPESAMVRRLNTRLNDVLPNHYYRVLIRELVVHRHLSLRHGSPRLALPLDTYAWASDLSRRWVSELALRGYDVVGDLDDLLAPGPAPYVDPDTCEEAEVADAALEALALMTGEAARLLEVEERLHADIADLMGQLDRFHGTRAYRAKQKLVGLAGSNPLARAGLFTYRRLRGRNSRST